MLASVRVILITWLFLVMICLDKKQSERPCEREGIQSEPLSEGEGESSKQTSEREKPNDTLSLLAEGKLGFERHYFCSLFR